MNYSRIQTKIIVLQEQTKMVDGYGFVPVCPRCGKPKPSDMHEGLVKKGDVQGWPEEDRLLINHPANCVVLCHECHMSLGQTTEMTQWFVLYKTELGYDLAEWLDSLPFKIQSMRTGYVREYFKTPK